MTASHGLYNPKLNLVDQGIKGFRNAYFNLTEPDLITHSLARKEGELGIGGTLLVETGKFTGRSPKDKHIVVTETRHARNIVRILVFRLSPVDRSIEHQ